MRRLVGTERSRLPPATMPAIIIWSTLAASLSGCRAFAPSCTTPPRFDARLDYSAANGEVASSSAAAAAAATATKVGRPSWVPMELVELLATSYEDEDDHNAPRSLDEFVRKYTDVEAYTSCDDDADDFHECDFFGQYLGPTKWLHLTSDALDEEDNVDWDVHFRIWEDVWRYPRLWVDVADRVSKDCLR